MAIHIDNELFIAVEKVGFLREKYKSMENNNPQQFMDQAETLRYTYKSELEPILKTAAAYFSPIRNQMRAMDAIYNRQMEARAKIHLDAMPEAERYRK